MVMDPTLVKTTKKKINSYYKDEGYEKQLERFQNKGIGKIEQDWKQPDTISIRMKSNYAWTHMDNNKFYNYYFQEARIANAKATRFRALKDSRELEQHAGTYRNRSASKRKGKAQKASNSYAKLAKMQAEYKEKSGRGEYSVMEEIAKREAIARQRIDAIQNGIMAKSISKEQEQSAIARAQYKHLNLLYMNVTQYWREKNEEGVLTEKDRRAISKKNTELKEELEKLGKKVEALRAR